VSEQIHGGVLVDSNVILDILTNDQRWLMWSSQALEDAAEQGPIFINSVIYAEISVRFDRIEDLDESLVDFQYLEVPRAACFLAGKCFLKYRRSGGAKTSPLPDFFVGAHAMVGGLPLLTRDRGRYQSYFPKLKIIAPD
jgi:predicted nucleic acid-binding protein